MAVVHSDVARLQQMGGSQPRMYVFGTCDVHLSVVGAMGRSWYSHWGEFQHTLSECAEPMLAVGVTVKWACASNMGGRVDGAMRRSVL
jgi:hypothetical protein